MPVDKIPVTRSPVRPLPVAIEPEEPARKSDPNDPRIGESVEEGVRWVSFPDGHEYRCQDGQIAERVH